MFFLLKKVENDFTNACCNYANSKMTFSKMNQVENSHDENRLLFFKLFISMHWNIVNLYGYLSALFHIKYTTKYI